MKKIKDWLLSSTKNKVIFGCGIVALAVIICVASFFIFKKATKHEHTVDYKYESLNDGTHKKTSYCTDEDGRKCKDFNSETTTEECEFDKDGTCKYCGYYKYVTVKFLSNIDDSVVKEMKVERGTSLNPDKDYPQPPEVDGYEFSMFEGNYKDIGFDTEIILVYNAISKENSDISDNSNSSNSNNDDSNDNSSNNINSNNSSDSSSNNSNDSSNSSSLNSGNSSNGDEEDYSDWGNSSNTSPVPYRITEEGIREAAEKFRTWLTTDPTVVAFYTEHGYAGSKQLTEGIGGEFDLLLIGADGATQTVHYKE